MLFTSLRAQTVASGVRFAQDTALRRDFSSNLNVIKFYAIPVG